MSMYIMLDVCVMQMDGILMCQLYNEVQSPFEHGIDTYAFWLKVHLNIVDTYTFWLKVHLNME